MRLGVNFQPSVVDKSFVTLLTHKCSFLFMRQYVGFKSPFFEKSLFTLSACKGFFSTVPSLVLITMAHLREAFTTL